MGQPGAIAGLGLVGWGAVQTFGRPLLSDCVALLLQEGQGAEKGFGQLFLLKHEAHLFCPLGYPGKGVPIDRLPQKSDRVLAGIVLGPAFGHAGILCCLVEGVFVACQGHPGAQVQAGVIGGKAGKVVSDIQASLGMASQLPTKKRSSPPE